VVTEVYHFDLTTTTGAGASLYSQASGTGTTAARLYYNRATPNNIANINSQGFIMETDGADACTPADASYNTGIVSFSAYIYIEDLVSKQYLYCELEPNGTSYNRQFCVGIENGNVFIEINTADPAIGDNVETVTTPLNYQKGWNMIGVFSDPSKTEVHNVMPDGSDDSTGNIVHASKQFIDADNYITCIGGRRRTTTSAQDSFSGMINEFRTYSDEVKKNDLEALVDHNCENRCPICLEATKPTCIEYVNNAYIAKYDFAQTTYLTNVPDTGPNALDFVLLDDQTSYDPIYVDNQGLYFDASSHMRTTSTYTQNTQNSMTVEGWIRPSQTTLAGTLLAFESAPNINDFSVKLSGNSFLIDFGGTTATLPFTYAAADVDTWQYFGVSFRKISPTQSRV
jgi:hypothetical protein